MTTLYAHQQKIVDEDPKKCGLFLGTGSGKTRTALALGKGKILVICPKTTAIDSTWTKDGNDVTVISKETFRRDWDKLSRYDTVIIDEVHTVCGISPVFKWVKKQPVPKTSQLFDACHQFIQQTNPSRLYLLTATPVRNPLAVFALLVLLGKSTMEQFESFRRSFYIPVNMNHREIYMAKKDEASQDKLGKLVQSMGYVGKLEQYMDVPPQTYKTVYVELTDEQKKRLKELPIEYPEPIVLCGKKHQVENGVLSGDEYNAPEYFNNEKIEKIREYALEFPKIVIFAKYRAQITSIDQALTVDGYNVLQLTGDSKDRDDILNQANSSDKCIIVISAQISAGYELPDFPVMIFASMSFSIVDRIQAEGRVLRANALKKNLYITLVTKGNTVDDAVNKSIDNKKDFSEAIYLQYETRS
jgi:superfamily II DNA or RNA helicase